MAAGEWLIAIDGKVVIDAGRIHEIRFRRMNPRGLRRTEIVAMAKNSDRDRLAVDLASERHPASMFEVPFDTIGAKIVQKCTGFADKSLRRIFGLLP